MDECVNISVSAKMILCYGCLSKEDENALSYYSVQDRALKTLLQMEHVCLCHLCKRIAQKAELFIQTVQNNQKLLENIHNVSHEELVTLRSRNPSIIQLAHFPQDAINIMSEETNIQSMYNYNKKVKLEMKQEDGEREKESGDCGDCDDDFDDNDAGPLKPPVKQEEQEYEFNILMKQEIDAEPIKSVRKRRKPIVRRRKQHIIDKIEDDDYTRSTEVKQEESYEPDLKQSRIDKKPLQAKQLRKRLKPIVTRITSLSDDERDDSTEVAKIEMIHITRKQCMEERAKMMLDKKYLSSTYKCENCIKGFTLKDSYDTHMKKHSKAMGEFECNICKQRMDSDDKLQGHKKYHEVRYKCGECGLTRICRSTIKDHYSAFHFTGNYQYKCPHCLKDFKREITLRKHISYTHRQRERVTCAYCGKSYASRDVLKSHLIRYHPKEVSAREREKNCICKDCGLAFPSPSTLKIHSVRHSDRRDYYCVECDKSFKSDSILKQHLKTASAHTSHIELPLACQYCDKRFAVRRNLDRHINKVHLHVKPFQCDKCEKAYVNDWSLADHKRRIHEGYKPPLKFQCPMCDKAFGQNKILKNHIRTHTGERPYQCTRCPAAFSQASILGTHVKLIHLKLTRDGRPKAQIK